MAGTGKPIGIYEAARHVFIKGRGHLWPDTKANREAGRTTLMALPDEAAKPFGKLLKRVGDTDASPGPATLKGKPPSAEPKPAPRQPAGRRYKRRVCQSVAGMAGEGPPARSGAQCITADTARIDHVRVERA